MGHYTDGNISCILSLEINKILDNFRAEYVKRYATGDPEQLLQMYHPEAVVIHVGQFAKHQHDGKAKLFAYPQI